MCVAKIVEVHDLVWTYVVQIISTGPLLRHTIGSTDTFHHR